LSKYPGLSHLTLGAEARALWGVAVSYERGNPVGSRYLSLSHFTLGADRDTEKAACLKQAIEFGRRQRNISDSDLRAWGLGT